MTDFPISGFTAPGFEPVQDAFEANFTEDKELGAGFAAYLDGALILDLQGGFADRKAQTPWDAETIVPVYSTTKPIAALTLAHVIDALPAGYDTPVADLWPDFAANGKSQVTLAQVVSHQAGLPGFIAPIDPGLWLDPPACAVPGSQSGANGASAAA
ncbi:MAG: serine hydrolase domain-containing protein, partial [Pseudomonadota bacterium]